MTETVVIIPARGGSKGIPNKNVTAFCGRPLIAHSILAARAASGIDRVVVTTDSESVAEVSRQFGAEVVMRPAELATDEASSEAALLHALDTLASQTGLPKTLVFIQCTSPLTQAFHIEGALAEFRQQQAQSCLAVTPFHGFIWSGEGAATGVNHNKSERLRRQDRAAEYLETGALYVMDVAGFQRARHRFFGKTVMYVMEPEYVQEIDDPHDLVLAEHKWRTLAGF